MPKRTRTTPRPRPDSNPNPTQPRPEFGIQYDPQRAEQIRKTIAKQTTVAVDTECTGLNFWLPEVSGCAKPAPFLISTCDTATGNQNHYFGTVDPRNRYVSWPGKTLDKLRRHLSSFHNVVFHNALYDMRALAAIDVHVPEIFPWSNIHDTLAMAHVNHSFEEHGLKPLAEYYLDYPANDESDLRNAVIEYRRQHKDEFALSGAVGADYWLPHTVDPSNNLCLQYCLHDTARTALLFRMFLSTLGPNFCHYLREQRLLEVVYTMQTNGVSVLKKRLNSTMTDLSSDMENHRKACVKLAGKKDLNLNSPKQLAEIIHDKFNCSIFSRTKTGQPSTDERTLLLLQAEAERRHPGSKQHAFLDHLLSYRQFKTGYTYLASYRERAIPDGNSVYILHPNYNPWGTATTRFSSSDPNLQNVSKGDDLPLRKVYGPRPGRIWYSRDYNQLEIRIMAKCSGDKTLQRVLLEGLDMHQYTADGFGISRKAGKNINFAWQYGAGATKLSLMAGVDAEAFRQTMKKRYPQVVAYMAAASKIAETHGFIRTLSGYPLQVDRASPYKATNYSVQGTAGDFCKNAMVDIHDYLTDNHLHTQIHMIVTLHDELVFEVLNPKLLPPIHMQNISRLMSRAGDAVNCPTPISESVIRSSWGEPEEQVS
jgi:DNA polymerase I-like protein with 3'-5' exonuclease and polymerase domains